MKFNLKLKFKDEDKLAYNPRPNHDWVVIFSFWFILLIVWAVLHVFILLSLEQIKTSGYIDTASITIDEKLLDQATQIIEARKTRLEF